MEFNKRYITRRLVQIKFFMSIFYDWVRTPALVTVALGVIKPYVDQYIDVSLWLLVLLTTIGTIVGGYFLVKVGVVKASTSYAQEQNTLLNNKLEIIQNSVDKIEREISK